MDNCLITTLKGVVNDPSLMRLGVAEFQFKITSGTMRGLLLRFNKAVRVTTSHSCTVLDTSAAQVFSSNTSFDLSAAFYYIKPDNVDQVVTVSVEDKYCIKQVGSSGGQFETGLTLLPSAYYLSSLAGLDSVSGCVVDLDLLKESPMTRLYLEDAAQVSGKLSSLRGSFTALRIRMKSDGVSSVQGNLEDVIQYLAPSLKQLYLTKLGSGFVGDISQVDFPLTTLQIGGSGVSGNMEGFLEHLYAYGDNCSLQLPRNVLLNGAKFTNSDNWTGSAIISDGVLTLKDAINNVFATYDGSTWTYA